MDHSHQQILLVESLDSIRSQGIALATAGRFADASTVFKQGYGKARESGSNRHALQFLTYLANIQFKLADYRRAMEYYIRAKSLAELSGDHEMAGIVLMNISSLYLALGALEEATQSANTALEILPANQSSSNLPKILAHRARLYALDGNMKQAISFYGQANREADRQGDILTQVKIWNELGYEFLKRDQLDAAERALTEAFRLSRLNLGYVSAQIFKDLSMLRMSQGDLASATALIDQAFVAARTAPNSLPEWSLYYRRAMVESARDRLDEAYKDLETALEYIRARRLNLFPSDSIQAEAGVSISHFYDFFIRTLARLYVSSGREELAREAFNVAEENRAVALRKSLGDSDKLRDRLPTEYWETLQHLVQTENRMFQTATTGYRNSLEKLRQKLTEIEIQTGWRLADETGNSGATIRTISSREVQRALSEKEALLSFHSSEPASYLWALTRDNFDLIRLPGRAQISRQVKEFRRAVENSSPKAVDIGGKLYTSLLGGIGDAITSKPKWLITPDDTLFQLPFPAMVISGIGETPVYLMEKHNLRILPTAAMLLSAPRKNWDGPLVVVNDPIYNTADPRWEPEEKLEASLWRRLALPTLEFKVSAATSRRFELARLIGSRREAQACVNAYDHDAHTSVMLAGNRARIRDIKAFLDAKPSVMHFATHVVPSPEHSDVGHIALSLRDNKELELLGPAMISTLHMNSGVVVMSGCSSGSGKILPGEGVWGLSRAWLRAGAHNVAATLWATPDHSGELLQAFYRRLGRVEEQGFSQAPEEALRLAQVEMLHSNTWRSRPNYWAAFFIVCNN